MSVYPADTEGQRALDGLVSDLYDDLRLPDGSPVQAAIRAVSEARDAIDDGAVWTDADREEATQVIRYLNITGVIEARQGREERGKLGQFHSYLQHQTRGRLHEFARPSGTIPHLGRVIVTIRNLIRHALDHDPEQVHETLAQIRQLALFVLDVQATGSDERSRPSASS